MRLVSDNENETKILKISFKNGKKHNDFHEVFIHRGFPLWRIGLCWKHSDSPLIQRETEAQNKPKILHLLRNQIKIK